MLRSGSLEIGTSIKMEGQSHWRSHDPALRSELIAFLETHNRAKSERDEAAVLAAVRDRDNALPAVAFSTRSLFSLPAEFGSRLKRGLAYAKFLAETYPADAPPGSCVLFPHQSAENRTKSFLGRQL